MAFWLNGVIYAALLTLAALAPRAVAPCFHLVFYLSTFRAFLPCLYRLVSHIPYYSIIALVWTLPLICSWSHRIHRMGQWNTPLIFSHTRKIQWTGWNDL